MPRKGQLQVKGPEPGLGPTYRRTGARQQLRSTARQPGQVQLRSPTIDGCGHPGACGRLLRSAQAELVDTRHCPQALDCLAPAVKPVRSVPRWLCRNLGPVGVEIGWPVRFARPEVG